MSEDMLNCLRLTRKSLGSLSEQQGVIGAQPAVRNVHTLVDLQNSNFKPNFEHHISSFPDSQ